VLKICGGDHLTLSHSKIFSIETHFFDSRKKKHTNTHTIKVAICHGKELELILNQFALSLSKNCIQFYFESADSLYSKSTKSPHLTSLQLTLSLNKFLIIQRLRN